MSAKFNFDYVKEYFKDQGCQLLSTEYKNATDKLDYICVCGNESSVSFNRFKNLNQRCSDCAGNKKHNLDFVKGYIKSFGFDLLSKEYKNNKKKLKIKCQNNHIFTMSFHDFTSGKRCSKCYGNEKYSYEYVYNYFLENNCLLLEENYISVMTKMKYKCSCGNESNITFSKFMNGQRCKSCRKEKISKSQRVDYEYIKSEIEKVGAILLTRKNDYKNNTTKLLIICHCGKKNHVTWHSYRKSKKCKNCRAINQMGSKNHNWDSSKTIEERQEGRMYTDYTIWRNEVYKRDNFTCQCCGSKNNIKIVAHHLDSYDWCKGYRTDVNNGITLCVICHKNFHDIFGYGLNTTYQFEDYMIGISWHI